MAIRAPDGANKTNVSDTGCIDGELVESIVCNIPNISNRNILRTLTILRRKLPKKHFQANLKKVIQQRTNLLEDLFETNPEDVSDGEGNIIKMPVTNTKDLNTLIHVVCEKRGVDPENIKLMLGGWNIEQMLRGDGYHPLNDQIMRSI